MVRYQPDHKAKTRERLVETARKEFREHGFDGVSIHTIMRAAGLTRGGFYAHFESKEALIQEVLKLEPGLLRQLRGVESGPRAPSEVAEAFEAYLDPKVRDGLIYCPLVAHPMDSIRGGQARGRAYAALVQELVQTVQARLPGDDREANRRAVVSSVLAVGAAIMSSALSGEEADQLQKMCSEEIGRLLNER